MSKAAKRFVFWMAAILMLAAASRMIPVFVRDAIPSIYYVTPTVRLYENVVNCSGTLQAAERRQIILDGAVIPQQIHVAVGDRVSRGDVLATFLPTSFAGIAGTLPQLSIDADTIAALLSAYGISSLLGEAGLDSGELTQYLAGGASSAASPTPAGTETGEIAAPISGVVTAVSLSPYLPAASGSAAFTIMDTKSYLVSAAVSEADTAKITVGDRAKIRVAAFPGSAYDGKITKIYPTARKSLNGTVTETVVDVEILMQNPDSRLKPGFSAKVEIAGKNNYELVTVPYEAVRQDENNNEYVYTYQDGKIRKASIITGQELSDGVEVLDGLAPDSIVIHNPDQVSGEGAMIHLKGRADAA